MTRRFSRIELKNCTFDIADSIKKVASHKNRTCIPSQISKLQDGNPIFNHRGGGLLQRACVGGTVDLHLLAVNIKCKHHIALLSIKVRVIKT